VCAHSVTAPYLLRIRRDGVPELLRSKGSTMRSRVRSSRLLRAGVVGLAVLASSALALPAARAAPTEVIALDSEATTVGLWPQESYGGPMPISAYPTDIPATPVDIAWGGAVTVTLPPQLTDGGAMEVSLELGPDVVQANATKTYSTATADLTVTALGGNQFQVDMPADDGVNGPMGFLTFSGVDVAGGVDAEPGPAYAYILQLSPGGAATVALAPQLDVLSRIPDATFAGAAAATVAPGGAVDLVIQSPSRLTQLGISDFGTSDLGISRFDGSGFTPGPAVTSTFSPDLRTATVTVPEDIDAGEYLLSVVLGDGTDAIRAQFKVKLVVAAVNPGLLSETGGPELTPSLPVGAYLAGGLVVAVVVGSAVRFRRAQQG
jgi:hypothetical protein